MAKQLKFKILGDDSYKTKLVDINRLLCIGYAGRDQDKVMEHIEELEAIGVPRPKSIPEVYHLGVHLIETNGQVHVIGDRTSGEVEFSLLFADGKTYIGIASDHTDRELETVSIIKSKQVCQKPIATDVWDYEDVVDHWDDLILRSWVEKDGEKLLYQEHPVTAVVPLQKVVETVKKEVDGPLDGIFVLSGTVPLLNGFQYGSRFWGELEDPVCERKISLQYRIHNLID